MPILGCIFAKLPHPPEDLGFRAWGLGLLCLGLELKVFLSRGLGFLVYDLSFLRGLGFRVGLSTEQHVGLSHFGGVYNTHRNISESMLGSPYLSR